MAVVSDERHHPACPSSGDRDREPRDPRRPLPYAWEPVGNTGLMVRGESWTGSPSKRSRSRSLAVRGVSQPGRRPRAAPALARLAQAARHLQQHAEALPRASDGAARRMLLEVDADVGAQEEVRDHGDDADDDEDDGEVELRHRRSLALRSTTKPGPSPPPAIVDGFMVDQSCGGAPNVDRTSRKAAIGRAKRNSNMISSAHTVPVAAAMAAKARAGMTTARTRTSHDRYVAIPV